MQEVVKRNTVDTDELFDLTPDNLTATVDASWHDSFETFIDVMMTAEDVEMLVNDSSLDDLIHTFKWRCKWTSVTWDDLAELLDSLKNAVIERISAEQ